MAFREEWAGRLVIITGGLILVYGSMRVLAPFVSVLAAAAIIAVVVYPLYTRLLRKISKSAAAGVVAGGVFVLIAVPLSLGAWYLARESVHAYPLLREAIENLAGVSGAQPPAWVPVPTRDYLHDLDGKNMLLENVHEIGAWFGRMARATIANAATAAMDILVFMLCLFVFLRDGRTALDRLLVSIPLASEPKSRIFDRAYDMVIATVQGVFVVAILQGLLSMIGFALFGIRFPVLLGALCMMFSPIPFIGPTLVWIPVAARVALDGQIGKAALLAAWFVLIVGTSDNVVRPILIGNRSRLPVATVVIGVLGGIKAFGVIGTFLGPVIMAILVAVVDTLFLSSDHEND